MMFKSRCKNCPDRRVEIGYNCHDHCERNKAAIADSEAQKAFGAADQLARDYAHDKRRRRRRK